MTQIVHSVNVLSERASLAGNGRNVTFEAPLGVGCQRYGLRSKRDTIDVDRWFQLLPFFL